MKPEKNHLIVTLILVLFAATSASPAFLTSEYHDLSGEVSIVVEENTTEHTNVTSLGSGRPSTFESNSSPESPETTTDNDNNIPLQTTGLSSVQTSGTLFVSGSQVVELRDEVYDNIYVTGDASLYLHNVTVTGDIDVRENGFLEFSNMSTAARLLTDDNAVVLAQNVTEIADVRAYGSSVITIVQSNVHQDYNKPMRFYDNSNLQATGVNLTIQNFEFYGNARATLHRTYVDSWGQFTCHDNSDLVFQEVGFTGPSWTSWFYINLYGQSSLLGIEINQTTYTDIRLYMSSSSYANLTNIDIGEVEVRSDALLQLRGSTIESLEVSDSAIAEVESSEILGDLVAYGNPTVWVYQSVLNGYLYSYNYYDNQIFSNITLEDTGDIIITKEPSLNTQYRNHISTLFVDSSNVTVLFVNVTTLYLINYAIYSQYFSSYDVFYKDTTVTINSVASTILVNGNYFVTDTDIITLADTTLKNLYLFDTAEVSFTNVTITGDIEAYGDNQISLELDSSAARLRLYNNSVVTVYNTSYFGQVIAHGFSTVEVFHSSLSSDYYPSLELYGNASVTMVNVTYHADSTLLHENATLSIIDSEITRWPSFYLDSFSSVEITGGVSYDWMYIHLSGETLFSMEQLVFPWSGFQVYAYQKSNFSANGVEVRDTWFDFYDDSILTLTNFPSQNITNTSYETKIKAYDKVKVVASNSTITELLANPEGSTSDSVDIKFTNTTVLDRVCIGGPSTLEAIYSLFVGNIYAFGKETASDYGLFPIIELTNSGNVSFIRGSTSDMGYKNLINELTLVGTNATILYYEVYLLYYSAYSNIYDYGTVISFPSPLDETTSRQTLSTMSFGRNMFVTGTDVLTVSPNATTSLAGLYLMGSATAQIENMDIQELVLFEQTSAVMLQGNYVEQTKVFGSASLTAHNSNLQRIIADDEARVDVNASTLSPRWPYNDLRILGSSNVIIVDSNLQLENIYIAGSANLTLRRTEITGWYNTNFQVHDTANVTIQDTNSTNQFYYYGYDSSTLFINGLSSVNEYRIYLHGETYANIQFLDANYENVHDYDEISLYDRAGADIYNSSLVYLNLNPSLSSSSEITVTLFGSTVHRTTRMTGNVTLNAVQTNFRGNVHSYGPNDWNITHFPNLFIDSADEVAITEDQDHSYYRQAMFMLWLISTDTAIAYMHIERMASFNNCTVRLLSVTFGSYEGDHTTQWTGDDTDQDGLSDIVEVDNYNTDPNNWDTDGDGYSDGEEILYGTGPNNPGHYPEDIFDPKLVTAGVVDGAHIRNNFTLFMNASDNRGVYKVNVEVNGDEIWNITFPPHIVNLTTRILNLTIDTWLYPQGDTHLEINVWDLHQRLTSKVFEVLFDNDKPMIVGFMPKEITNGSLVNGGTSLGMQFSEEVTSTYYRWDYGANLTYLPPVPFGDGFHVLEVWFMDYAGNAANETFVFTVNDQLVFFYLESPVNESSHQSGTTVELELSQDPSDVYYSWDGGSNNSATVSYRQISLSIPTADGQHTLDVYAVSIYGRWTHETYVFTTDNTPISLVDTIPVNNSIIEAEVVPVVSFDENPTEIYYSWNGSANETILTAPPNINAYHLLEVWVADPVGNWGYYRLIFQVDSLIEVWLLGLNNNSDVRSGVYITHEFSQDPAQVLYSWDGEANSTIITQVPNTEGYHYLKVYTSTNTGKWASFLFGFNVDNTAIEISLASPSNGTKSVSGQIVTVSLSESPFNLTYMWDDNDTTLLNSSVGTEFTTSFPLGNGWHKLEIWASDEAGNVGYQFYYFETSEPGSITLVSPSDGSTINEDSKIILEIRGTLGTYNFRWDNATTWQTKPINVMPQVPILDGEHYLYVKCFDEWNTVVTETYRFVVDNPEVEITLVSPNNLHTISEGMPVVLTFSPEPAEVFYRWNDATSTTTELTDIPNIEGLQKLEVTAVSFHGDVTVRSYWWTVDINEPPSVDIVYPAADQVLKGEITINWQASDPEDNRLFFDVYIGYGGVWASLATGLTSTNLKVDTTQFEDGDYQFKVVAYEESGLFSEAILDSVTFDNSDARTTTSERITKTVVPGWELILTVLSLTGLACLSLRRGWSRRT